MRLPDDVFDEIVLHAEGARATPSALGAAGEASWRRREPRRRLDAAVAFTRYGAIGPATREAGLRDLSPAGLGLVMRDALIAPGELFVVHPPRAEGQYLDLLCTARAVRVGRDGAFHVGAEFCSGDEPGVVDHVALVRSTVCGSIRVGEAPQARADRRALWGFTAGRNELQSAAVQRREERSALQARAQLFAWGRDGRCGDAEPVEVVDLSPGGIGLWRTAAMRPGDQFLVEVPRVDERPVRQFCAVARVVATGDRHRVGARFIPFGQRHGRGWLARVFDWVV
jgi:hypothetical protein